MRPRIAPGPHPVTGESSYGVTLAKMTVALPSALFDAASRTATEARRNRPLPAATFALPVAVTGHVAPEARLAGSAGVVTLPYAGFAKESV